jgi:hypothetical protein
VVFDTTRLVSLSKKSKLWIRQRYVVVGVALGCTACAPLLGLEEGTERGGGPTGSGGMGGSGGQGGAAPCLNGSPSYWDDFERTETDGWGTSNSDHRYVYNDSGRYAVANGVGQIPYPNNTYYYAEVPVTLSDFELVGTVSWADPPSGTTELLAGIQFRVSNSANNYELRFNYAEGNPLLLTLTEELDGTEANITTVDLGGNVSQSGYRVRLQVEEDVPGSLTWSITVWPAGEMEGGAATLSESGTWSDAMGPASGGIRMHARRTGPEDVVVSFDDLFVCPL